MTTTVVNRYAHTPTAEDVYIGRPGPWGNPFIEHVDGTRAEVIAKHLAATRARLAQNPKLLAPLRGKVLVCWCKPKECHGDNYVLLLKETK